MQGTVVQYYGEQNRSRCGYCRNTNSSNSHGMHAYIMSPQDYQDLIDRGWRRSGQYCYKPNNPSTCCPCYTIRCNVQEFKLSKSQKKVLKRMNKFLQNGIKDKGDSVAGNGSSTGSAFKEPTADHGRSKEEPDIPKITLKDIDLRGITNRNPERNEATTNTAASTVDPTGSRIQIAEKRRDGTTEFLGTELKAPIHPPCKKAKQMRLERRQAKLQAQGIIASETAKHSKSSTRATSQEKTLKEYIEDIPENARHKLTVLIVPSNKGVTRPVLELYRKYQTVVHNDPPQKNTQKSFERFLVLSPLQLTRGIDGLEVGYGSFHQQYWLDDRLIAVGVIDILPYCVSSVYFFYDPEFNFLSLGTYGSLREVYLTNKLSEQAPSLKYYYMGFYIHSCPKMIYKGRLTPSYLLCPEVYTWHLLTDVMRKKLDEVKYQRLNNEVNVLDSNNFRQEDLDSVLIMYDHSSFMTYKNYMESICTESVDQVLDFLRRTLNLEAANSDETRAAILEYGQLVGKTCAHRMIYVI